MEKDCYKKKRDEKAKAFEWANLVKEKDDDVVLTALNMVEDFMPSSGNKDESGKGSSVTSGDYMDDHFFDHFSSKDDFDGPTYVEEEQSDETSRSCFERRKKTLESW